MTRSQELFQKAGKQLNQWRFSLWLCHAYGIMETRMDEDDIKSLESQLEYQHRMQQGL